MAEKKAQNFESIQNEPISNTLLQRYKEAEKSREKYDEQWDRNNSYYNSDQWINAEKVAGYQSEPVVNKIFEYVETMRGYLSDNDWGVSVVPSAIPDDIATQIQQADSQGDPTMEGGQKRAKAKEQLLDKVNKVNKLCEFLWYDCRMSRKLAVALQDSFLTGSGFLKTTFDPENISNSGIGQIDVRPVSPYYIYPDPDATDIDDAAFIIEKHPVSVRWVIDNYPDKAKEFLDNVSASTMDAAPQGSQTKGPVNIDEGQRVDVLECWFKDSTMVQEFDEELGTDVEKSKYPNGRYIVMSDQGVILEDRECEYKTWPYVIIRETIVPNQFWGGCTIDKVISLQDSINQILRSIIDNGLWLVHGIWICDTTSGVAPSDLQGYGPRDVVMKAPQGEIRRDSGPALPNHLFQTYQDLLKAMDTVLGFPDVLRGIVPSRQPVQTTMIQQESGEVRTRERARRVEEALTEWGIQALNIVRESWADARLVKSRGFAGFDMFLLSKEDLEGWEFSIFVRPGSTTPSSVTEMLQRAIEMKTQAGVMIPDEYIAGLSGLPGIEAALVAQQQQMMQMEAAANGQAPQAGGGDVEAEGFPINEDGTISQNQMKTEEHPMDFGPEAPSPEMLAAAAQMVDQGIPPVAGV